MVEKTYQDLGFAKLDIGRAMRRGVPEVILCTGKEPSQLVIILKELAKYIDRDGFALATRAEDKHFEAVRQELGTKAQYFKEARLILIGPKPHKSTRGDITILTGGTSDIPVAEEAAITAEILGNQCKRIYDVGVAGIQRFFDNLTEIRKARVLIIVAGMEGALASLTSGLVAVPIIAVPTSIGYGANFAGFTPLLAMLNSCSPGMSVVNIDNGFGAAYMAHLINNMKTVSQN